MSRSARLFTGSIRGQARLEFSGRVVESWTFENAQRLDLTGLKGRLLSSSAVPAEGEPGCAEILAEIEDVFRMFEQGGTVTVRYDARVYVGRLQARHASRAGRGVAASGVGRVRRGGYTSGLGIDARRPRKVRMRRRDQQRGT